MINKEKMTMILKEDLLKSLSQYDNKIYNYVKENKVIDLNETIQNELYSFYELCEKNDDLSFSKKEYLKDFINSYIQKKLFEFQQRINNRKIRTWKCSTCS